MEQLDMEQFRTRTKQDFVKLLDLLARVIDANKGFSTGDISDGERLLAAHYLANKFIDHAFTVLYLSHGTNVRDIPSFKSSFIDSASIDVLTRATMEAFLVFHYVFYAPTTKEEKDYRYWAYNAAGITERQSIPIITEETRRTLDNDRLALDKLRDKLKSNAVFQNLTEKQKARFFEGKERNLWRWNPDLKKVLSWSDIAIDAGFSEMLASHMYRHLSGHAHSGSLSVLQSQQVLINKEIEQLIGGSIGTINIVAANLIREYCALLSLAQDVLSKDPEGNDIVEEWIQIGHDLDEFTNIGRGHD
ncbi:DUF5677 domain-containing protein [Chloroflexota bacterium]